MKFEKRSFVEKVKTTFGDAPPRWIIALAGEADRTSLRQVGDRLGYSSAAISYVLANKYAGDVKRIEEKVSGIYMGAKVTCPVAGEIDRDWCVHHQERTDKNGWLRSNMFRHCRGIGVEKCPHSLVAERKSGGAAR